MGIVCESRKESEKVEASCLTISNLIPFPLISFQLTTELLSRINCDCLLLFTDRTLKVERNVILNKVSKKVARKIQEFLDIETQKARISPGQSVVFRAQIPQLGFEEICVLCLDIWGGRISVKQPLEQCLTTTLQELRKRGSALCITSFNNEFGIPINQANRCLLNCIEKEKEGLQKVTIMFEHLQSAEEFKNQLEEKHSSILDESGYY